MKYMDISKLKIKELEALLAENPASELLAALQQDARASARKLAESYQKRQAKKLAEEARLQACISMRSRLPVRDIELWQV